MHELCLTHFTQETRNLLSIVGCLVASVLVSEGDPSVFSGLIIIMEGGPPPGGRGGRGEALKRLLAQKQVNSAIIFFSVRMCSVQVRFQ